LVSKGRMRSYRPRWMGAVPTRRKKTIQGGGELWGGPKVRRSKEGKGRLGRSQAERVQR